MHTKLSRFLLAYRSTPQTTTGVTPAELLFNRRLRMRVDLIRPDIRVSYLFVCWFAPVTHTLHFKIFFTINHCFVFARFQRLFWVTWFQIRQCVPSASIFVLRISSGKKARQSPRSEFLFSFYLLYTFKWKQ